MRWWEIVLLCLAGGIIAFAIYFLLGGLFFGWQESFYSAIGCGVGTFLGCLLAQVLTILKKRKK